MVHPAVAALTIGVGIGVFVFALFYNSISSERSRNRSHYAYHEDEAPRFTWRDPLSGIVHDLEDRCAICQDGLDGDLALLHCGHKYHEKCMQESLKFNNLCPLCREPARML